MSSLSKESGREPTKIRELQDVILDFQAERDALREALKAIHEFHCGCDTPGLLDFCVCEPREEFKILGRPE